MNKTGNLLAKLFTTNSSNTGSWLAILRIGAGISLMAKIISEYRSLSALYGSDGLVPVWISRFSQNPFIPSLNGIYHLAGGHLHESHFLLLFFFLQLLFAAFLVFGFTSRFSAVMCWLMQVVVFNSSHLISYGFDAVLLSMLFYSMVFPMGKYFSIDSIRKAAFPTPGAMMPLYLKVIQLHVCIIYLANGISKIYGHNWQDGSGIWDAINQPQFESYLTPLFRKILLIEHMPALVTWSTILVEIAYPFVVWVRGLNVIALGMIILLHVFIALAFGLWLFAFAMIVFNLAAFGTSLRANKNAIH